MRFGLEVFWNPGAGLRRLRVLVLLRVFRFSWPSLVKIECVRSDESDVHPETTQRKPYKLLVET